MRENPGAPGGNNNIGAEAVVRAPADGHTLLGSAIATCWLAPSHPSGKTWAHSASGGGGRRILFRQQRGGGESARRQAGLHSQSLDQQPGAQTRTEEALVPQRPEIAHRMRGPHQRRQTPSETPRSIALTIMKRSWMVATRNPAKKERGSSRTSARILATELVHLA